MFLEAVILPLHIKLLFGPKRAVAQAFRLIPGHAELHGSKETSNERVLLVCEILPDALRHRDAASLQFNDSHGDTVQVDNGREFVNDDDKTSKESAFEKAAYNLGITIKRTRPYSPWQNVKVERSHREDGKILYNRKVFTSEKDLINQVAKHERRYNSTAKTSLKFKSPNEVVEEYFKNTACYCEN